MSRPASEQVPRVSREIQRLALDVDRAMDDALSAFRVTYVQYLALEEIAAEPGIHTSELARRCHVTPQTMGRIVTILERGGLIDVRSAGGRLLALRPTRRGTQVVADCRRAAAEVEERLLAGLRPVERAELRELLVRSAIALRGR